MEVLTKTEDRRMLDLRCHNVTLIGPGFQQSANRSVVALSSAACKDNFYGIGRADQRGHPLSRLVNRLRYLAPKPMNARRIAVKVREKRSHRFEDFRQYRSRRVIIEVDFRSHGIQFFSTASWIIRRFPPSSLLGVSAPRRRTPSAVRETLAYRSH